MQSTCFFAIICKKKLLKSKSNNLKNRINRLEKQAKAIMIKLLFLLQAIL
jgi:hypothetical protein